MGRPDIAEVWQIVQTIVDFHNGDTEAVLAFYETAYEKFWGMNPAVDAVIDGLDDWLIGHRWLKDYVPEDVVDFDQYEAVELEPGGFWQPVDPAQG
ncbi:MAG: hypothetical protein IT324_34195 [Anaerolineae bacterium]|nr:hypothetical protein [Anaerolineae bacterium]